MLERPRFQDNSWGTFSGWFLLAFIAGSVNAGGFLAFNRFVTHVTGFATLFGIDVVLRDWGAALSILSVPLFYLGGSMISSYCVDFRIHRNKQPNYSFVLMLEFCALVAAAVGGMYGLFSEFGHDLELRRDYLLLALLCFSMGLQNAVVTSSSGSVVRSTHLTGVVTDLGIDLVRWFYLFRDGQRGEREYSKIVWSNWFRFGTIFSFAAGSTLGALMFLYYNYGGFFMPALLVLLALALVRSRKLKQRAERVSPQ